MNLNTKFAIERHQHLASKVLVLFLDEDEDKYMFQIFMFLYFKNYSMYYYTKCNCLVKIVLSLFFGLFNCFALCKQQFVSTRISISSTSSNAKYKMEIMSF
jgi:hypothetical protein